MNTVQSQLPSASTSGSRLIFFTGPVRSGKSRAAVELARGWGEDVVFVATYRPATDDPEMDERVRKHRAERPAWRVLEAPREPAAELALVDPGPSGVLLDSLTLWVSDRFEQEDAAVLDAWREQLRGLRALGCPVVLVGDEIGWSAVPSDAALRRFRDLVGSINQLTAAEADEAWLHVAGCPLRLK